MSLRQPPWLMTTVLLVANVAAASLRADAQTFTYRGFADAGVTLFPQEAPNDSTQAFADFQGRFEPSLEIRRGISAAGSIEGRADTHSQTVADVTFWDRTLERPALSVRTAAVTLSRGQVTLELGKQFVRWGQSDILSPTDYFTPKDYLLPVSNESLATTAARATVGGQRASVELVFTPRMTPSRIPLLDQRWVGAQAASAGLPLQNGNIDAPRRPQYGARWHQNTRRVEYSLSFFQGFNHLPVLEASLVPASGVVRVDRRYPSTRAWGGDAVAPLPGVTLKFETAWLGAVDRDATNYGLWVLQGERQQGDWLLLGGYVGDWVTAERHVFTFAPDRGLAKGIIARAGYTSGTNRTFVVEAVIRRNGDGLYTKAEYSHPLPRNWRVTVQALLMRGDEADFLGQYRENSFVRGRTRWSF